ncbi:hypothetical protein [Rubritalea sp.]|uniref:hypothetical protein n=1 Tax=Rubritalea sp. TaxID=2109375 RepID=UPI003EFAC677
MAKKTAKKATAKKTATKVAKKTAKKATKKVAAKKTTKKTAKKATKKAKAVDQELDLVVAKVTPTYDDLQQAAYFNYMERLKSGHPGTPELDWTKAEQDLI